jgi:hypothetical protein
MNIKDTIKNSIDIIKQRLNILKENNRKLEDDDNLIYEKYEKEINILEDLYTNKYEIYEILLRYIFVDKCYYSIEKSKLYSEDQLKDLYVIDNLHDFDATARTGGTKRGEEMIYIREIISKYLTPSMKEKLVRKKKLRGKEIVSVINVNSSQNVKNFIYQKYNISPILFNKSILPKYKLRSENNIYFESKGLYSIDEMTCPYKTILDGLDCSKDKKENREKLKFDDVKIDIKNYNSDNIQFIFSGNDVKAEVNNFDIYEPFLDKKDVKQSDSITINEKEYVIMNQVSSIYNQIVKLSKKYKDDELNKYILGGIFLKRIGDYSQVKIFMKSNLTFFQTVDMYCFLYACIICEPNKVLILDKKAIFTRISYNGELYDLYCNVANDKLMDRIKEKLKIMISKNKKGGMIDLLLEKVDEYMFRNMKRKQNEMKMNKQVKYEDIFYMKKLMNNIDDPIYVYLIVKQHIEKYKEIFGNNFDNILNIIILYKNFSRDIDPENLDYIRKIYEGVVRLKYIMNELLMEEQIYVNKIEMIYNLINNMEYGKMSYVFLFDCISYFEDYMDINFESPNLLRMIEERYEDKYRDEDGGGLTVNSKYEKELTEFNDIYEKIINGDLEYSDEEYEAFLEKYRYLDSVGYEEDNIGNNKYYQKYMKYKVKYIRLKKLNKKHYNR